jgi:hypothetical protein
MMPAYGRQRRRTGKGGASATKHTRKVTGPRAGNGTFGKKAAPPEPETAPEPVLYMPVGAAHGLAYAAAAAAVAGAIGTPQDMRVATRGLHIAQTVANDSVIEPEREQQAPQQEAMVHPEYTEREVAWLHILQLDARRRIQAGEAPLSSKVLRSRVEQDARVIARLGKQVKWAQKRLDEALAQHRQLKADHANLERSHSRAKKTAYEHKHDPIRRQKIAAEVIKAKIRKGQGFTDDMKRVWASYTGTAASLRAASKGAQILFDFLFPEEGVSFVPSPKSSAIWILEEAEAQNRAWLQRVIDTGVPYGVSMDGSKRGSSSLEQVIHNNAHKDTVHTHTHDIHTNTCMYAHTNTHIYIHTQPRIGLDILLLPRVGGVH